MGQLTDTQLVAILLPLLLLQAVLMISAIIVCIKAETTNGPRWMWLLIIIAGNIIGPILFFTIGRRSNAS